MLASREHVADFGAADDRFERFRPKLARHAGADFVGQRVDHVIIFERNLVPLGNLARLGVGPHVEADDRRAAGPRERNVALGNATDARMQHACLDQIGRDLVDRIDDRLDRALRIGLDHERIFDRLLFLERTEHALEARRATGGALAGHHALAIFRHFARTRFVFDDRQRVARTRHARQAEHFDRHRRAGFLDLLALVVGHRADLAALAANHEDVADPQRAAVHEHGRDRAAALVELGLDHGALGGAIGIGLQFEQFGLQLDLLDQLVESGLLERRDFDVLDVARHFLDHDFILQQRLADFLRVGVMLVDLVDRDDHRHAGGAGMVDRLHRLRLDRVVGGNHQYDDVGHIGSALAHFGKGFVAGRVEEGDLRLVLQRHLIRTDMLGDATGFPAHDIGAAQRVEQARLAVIDMTHDRNDGRTRNGLIIHIFVRVVGQIDVRIADADDVVTEFGDEQLGRVLVDRLRHRDGHAHLEQRLDQVGTLFRHAVGEFLDGDRFGNDHVADLLGLHFARAAHPAVFLLARTLQRGEAAGTGTVAIVERAVDGQLAAAPLVTLAVTLTGAGGRFGRGGSRNADRRALGCACTGGRARRRARLRRRGRRGRAGTLGTWHGRKHPRRGQRRIEPQRADRLGCDGRSRCRNDWRRDDWRCDGWRCDGCRGRGRGGGFGSRGCGRFGDDWRGHRFRCGLRRRIGRSGAVGRITGAAIFLGAAALFLLRFEPVTLFAATRFLERVHARFLGFAQQLGLQFLAGQQRVAGRDGRGCRRRCRARSLGDGRGGRGRFHHGRFGRTTGAEDTAALHFDHDGVRPPVAEALLDLAGLDRALQPKRLTHPEFRLFVVGVAHSSSSHVSSSATELPAPVGIF